MNFFKQAQELAASANTNTPAGDNTAAGDGSGAPPAAEGNLPGGRTAPTNSELMHSGQVLFGAAQGQKVDQSQLAGAASDLLGGLSAHGNLDQGTYGTYVNQAEQYLDKYSTKGQSQGQSAAGAGAGAGTGPAKVGAQDPADSANPDTAPVNAGSTDDYAPDQQQAGRGNSQY